MTLLKGKKDGVVTSPGTGDILWVAWEKQRRSTVLARHLGADLYQLQCRGHFLWRYLLLSVKTLGLLRKGRYSYVFVQNPSVVLCLLVVMAKPFLGCRVVVDAHTFYLKIRGVKKWIYDAVTRAIHGGADMVIVTNKALKEEYAGKFPQTRYWVLPDMIPPLPACPHTDQESGDIRLLLICTYAEDEPYGEVFKAMKDLPQVRLYVTGRKEKADPGALALKPPNVTLTGFIPDQAFFGLLCEVDIVIDLTDTDHCMVCGAYEAVAAEKPMVLSAKQVLMHYFHKGAVFTENRAENIAVAIRQAIADIENLKRDVRALKTEKQAQWQAQWAGLLTTVGLGAENGLGGYATGERQQSGADA